MGLKVCACDEIKCERAYLLCVVKLFFLTKKKKKGWLSGVVVSPLPSQYEGPRFESTGQLGSLPVVVPPDIRASSHRHVYQFN